MLIFVHMHKCAGSTIRRSAQRSGLQLAEPHKNGNLLDTSGKAIRYAEMPVKGARAIFEAEKEKGVEFLAMEWDVPRLSAIPRRGITLFTVLRDPLQRAVSNYRFVKLRGAAAPELTFREFMNYGFTRDGKLFSSSNYFTRKLLRMNPLAELDERHGLRASKVLERFDHVYVLGVDDLQARLRDLGITRYSHANAVSERAAKVSIPTKGLEVNEADRTWFEDHNQIDRILFEHAKRASLSRVSL